MVHCQFETIHPFLDGNARVGRFRCDKSVALREKWFRSMAEQRWNTRSHKIIGKLFGFPVVTLPQISKMLDITYPTARNDMGHLVKATILAESDVKQRPKIFIAPEIIRIAYTDFIAEEQVVEMP